MFLKKRTSKNQIEQAAVCSLDTAILHPSLRQGANAVLSRAAVMGDGIFNEAERTEVLNLRELLQVMQQDEELRRSQGFNGAASNLIEMIDRNEATGNSSHDARTATEEQPTSESCAEENLSPTLQATATYSQFVTEAIDTGSSTPPQKNSAAFIKTDYPTDPPRAQDKSLGGYSPCGHKTEALE